MHLNIEFPDDVAGHLQAMANAMHIPVEALVSDILIGELSDDLGAPELCFESDEELEAMLAKRLEDPRPSIEVSAQHWEALKRRVLGETGSE